MADDDRIEQCARLCDAMVKELEAQRPTSRKSHYDKQSPRQIDFAIRAVRRVADRIRAMEGVTGDAQAAAPNGDKLIKAIQIARELRPVLKAQKTSAWQQDMLSRLDEIISSAK